MNIYIKRETFNEIYYKLLKDLIEGGMYITQNRSGELLYEFINVSFCIEDPKNCFAWCREFSQKYLEGELEFYMSGSPFLHDISRHSTFWERCTDDGRSINSNYGKLLLHDRNHHNYTQFEYARDMLLRNKESKKAVMVIYNKENAYKSNDNPCTMYLQFFIRDNRLSLFVKMRSSDIWYGLPYDVPFFSLIQHLMFNALKIKYKELEIGDYHHQSGSLHLYERNFKLAKEKLSIVDEDSLYNYLKDKRYFKKITKRYLKK